MHKIIYISSTGNNRALHSLYGGMDLHECDSCGAVVSDPDLHSDKCPQPGEATHTVTVTPASGMDEKTLAEAIRREIDRQLSKPEDRKPASA